MPSQRNNRERILFDADWRFHRGDLPFAGPRFPLTKWTYKPVGEKRPTDSPSALKTLASSRSGFKPIKVRQEVSGQKRGYAWFRTQLPSLPGPGRKVQFTCVFDDCDVYLNGKKLASNERWISPFDVSLDEAWKESGPNVLLVLVRNTYGAGFMGEADLETAGRPQGPTLAFYKDEDWRKVHLPHDYVVEGRFDKKTMDSHGYLPGAVGWYRKSFDIPFSDKGRDLWLDFDGAFRDSRVYLNGRLLGSHKSGYTPFRFDITHHVRYGSRNVLAVRTDSRGAEGWWYEGGGLYRHVWLNKADRLHVKPWGVQVISKPQGKGASVQLTTTLVNHSARPSKGRLVSEVKDPKGHTVLKLSKTFSIPAHGEKSLSSSGRLAKASLWGLEHPNLYKVVTRIERDGKTVDSLTTSFGIRSIRFDKDKGFFLNGKPVKLQGTCNHQDHAGVGAALPDRLFAYRIEKLKTMGSNAYRCAHHPHADELMDACDRMGMLVIDENRRLGDTPDVLEQVKTMVLRDRNHPSIIAWSICNEEPLQGKPEGLKRATAMKKVVLKYDKTRPVTAAVNYQFETGFRKLMDIEGINYNIDQYQTFRKNHPNTPMYGSETASTVSTRGVYQTDPKKGYVSAYDVNHTMWSLPAEAAWRPIGERDFLAGAFIWTGFDYRGEPTPYQWPCINSHFGILDVCGFPKDNFWYYKAWWGKEPILHLFPHWNWAGKEGQEIDVWCHGNVDRVELFLNGALLGTKEIPRLGHIEWKARYKPGTLLARGWKDGKVILESKVETTGKPYSIRLEPYTTKLKADGEDVVPVEVSILDKEGRLVQTADNEVSFKVTGPGLIAGVGNGDPSSHEPDIASKRRAFNGKCAVYVKAGEKSGTLRLTARSKGLKDASLKLSVL